MTKTAIVKGVARWYGKNVVPMIPAFSLTKAGHMAAVIRAEQNPSVAEAFLMNVVPPGVGAMLQTISAAAQDNAVFDLAMKSLRDAVAQEAVSFPTPGKPPHMDGTFDMLNIRPSDIELIAGEIRTAQTEIDNAAVLAKADEPAKEGGVA